MKVSIQFTLWPDDPKGQSELDLEAGRIAKKVFEDIARSIATEQGVAKVNHIILIHNALQAVCVNLEIQAGVAKQ